jgi:hypothetical protein
MKLFDDGTHGDRTANDGIYTNVYKNSKKEGTYAFHVRASGRTGKCVFQREARIDRYLRVKSVPASLGDISIEELPSYVQGIDRLQVTVTPKDALGNLWGPRRADRISIRPVWGRLVGEIEDALNGSYRQIVETPSNLQPPQKFHVSAGHLHTLTKATARQSRGSVPPEGLGQQFEQMRRKLRSLPVNTR